MNLSGPHLLPGIGMESLFSLAQIATSCELFIQFKKICSLFEVLYLISTQFDDARGPVLASRED